MKEDYPELYEQVKQRVQEGRFEPQGAMWVEADTNVSGGEALVRQVLLGKRFFQKEFGVDINYLWLPDVFGYSAALPQILKKAGVDFFMTQKMSWNQVNTFPHHSFYWQGIDGSSVLAHMLPEETYNSPALPRSVVKIENNYHDKGISEHALMLFGIGDGGGGPGEEHLERLARIRNLAGLSPVRQEPAACFFEDWVKDAARSDGTPHSDGTPRSMNAPIPHLGRRVVPGAPFRHADHRSQEQVVQPPHGTGPARIGMDGCPGRKRISGRAPGSHLARSAALPVPRYPARLLHQARV